MNSLSKVRITLENRGIFKFNLDDFDVKTLKFDRFQGIARCFCFLTSICARSYQRELLTLFLICIPVVFNFPAHTIMSGLFTLKTFFYMEAGRILEYFGLFSGKT